MVTETATVDLREYYAQHLLHLWRHAPFVLRITERKDRPIPVLIVKERQSVNESNGQVLALPGLSDPPPQGTLAELGRLDGAALRRCLPILRQVVGRVRSAHDIPLELQRYLTQEGLKLRLNLPLDEEAGAKLGLIFRLQGRVTDLDRVELIARRVARFTREEAVYWLSRTTSFGSDANRWAVTGLRIMLGGHAKDPAVERMLEHTFRTLFPGSRRDFRVASFT